VASGPQPAVEGTGPGTAGPLPTPTPGTGSGGGVPARTVESRRTSEAGNGASPAHTRSEAAHRTTVPGAPSAAPTQRQATVPNQVAPLPVGRASGAGAAPPARRPAPRRAPRRRNDIRPVVVQGRRTRRVVRKIDVWTVLKMSFLFYLCVFLVFMIAGVVLWNIASAFNVIHSVEKFIRSIFDLQKFTFRPMVVLQSSALGGGVLVLLATGANVLAALLYNLISDVVGGVQFIVLEETAPPESN
jgi:hypothetical protein